MYILEDLIVLPSRHDLSCLLWSVDVKQQIKQTNCIVLVHSFLVDRFNPLVTNGFSHPYHLYVSIFIFRGIRSDFSFLFHFSMKIMSAHRIAPDGTPCFAILFANVPPKGCRAYMSLVMRKPAFCICENKDADQLRGNREADQRLCFGYTDSTTPLLPKSQISSL